MKLKQPREADIQRVIIQYLELLGAVVVRVNSGGMKVDGRFVRFNSEDGCSDLLGCLNGRMIAVETKRPGWTPAKPGSERHAREQRQGAFLDRVNRAGGLGMFARSVADVETALRAEGLL